MTTSHWSTWALATAKSTCLLTGTTGNHSSGGVAGSGGVIGLAGVVGAIGLATAGVTALTTAGVAGLPGRAGANIDQCRPSCCQGARLARPSYTHLNAVATVGLTRSAGTLKPASKGAPKLREPVERSLDAKVAAGTRTPKQTHLRSVMSQAAGQESEWPTMSSQTRALCPSRLWAASRAKHGHCPPQPRVAPRANDIVHEEKPSGPPLRPKMRMFRMRDGCVIVRGHLKVSFDRGRDMTSE